LADHPEQTPFRSKDDVFIVADKLHFRKSSKFQHQYAQKSAPPERFSTRKNSVIIAANLIF